MVERAYFERHALAEAMAGDLLRPALYGTVSPGLFLSAPRRTGKSTFLRRDLTPALQKRDVCVLYVDLWSNAEVSPSILIANAIGQALASAQGVLAKAVKASGISKVRIQGVEFSIDKVGVSPGATIGDALAELHRATGQKIAFIIDEAQHVVKMDPEMRVMKALKAARDEINQSEDILFLVMSGSDRDKLLRLVHGNGAPFLGAQIQSLPPLSDEYVKYAASRIARAYPSLKIDNQALLDIFKRYDHRPEFFEEDTARALSPLLGALEDFMPRLMLLAKQREETRDNDFVDMFNSLSPLQRAVIAELARPREGAPRLFTKEALARYALAAKKKISPGQARDAVERLRDRDPPILWKSDRGDYAFEDTGFQRWYESYKDLLK